MLCHSNTWKLFNPLHRAGTIFSHWIFLLIHTDWSSKGQSASSRHLGKEFIPVFKLWKKLILVSHIGFVIRIEKVTQQALQLLFPWFSLIFILLYKKQKCFRKKRPLGCSFQSWKIISACVIWSQSLATHDVQTDVDAQISSYLTPHKQHAKLFTFS